MKAILYRRVSTMRQAEDGQSLAAQEESLRAYAKIRGWEVVRSYQDSGKSGRSRKGRSGLSAAIELVCKERGVLCVYSLSRLARSVQDAAAILTELRNGGANLAIVDMALDTSTPHGELIFNMFASIAQFESQQIGERVRMVNRHIKKRLGYFTSGRPPYGWDFLNGQYVQVPHEQEIIAEARRIRRTRDINDKIGSYATVAAALNSRGIPGPNGGEWKPEAVRRVISRNKEMKAKS